MPQSSHQDFSRYGRVKYSQHVRVVESDATLLLQFHLVRRIHFCLHSTVICSFLFTLSKSSQASAASSPTAALLLITNCIHVCPWSDLDWGFGLCQCEKGLHVIISIFLVTVLCRYTAGRCMGYCEFDMVSSF